MELGDHFDTAFDWPTSWEHVVRFIGGQAFTETYKTAMGTARSTCTSLDIFINGTSATSNFPSSFESNSRSALRNWWLDFGSPKTPHCRMLAEVLRSESISTASITSPLKRDLDIWRFHIYAEIFPFAWPILVPQVSLSDLAWVLVQDPYTSSGDVVQSDTNPISLVDLRRHHCNKHEHVCIW